MSSNFTTTCHGKWILAGEHAVLRKSPAIVSPVLSKTLQLAYEENDNELSAEFSGDYAEEIHLLFWSVLESALERVKHPLAQLRGKFKITNHIPLGVGMGVSAALCVAITRWFAHQTWIDNNKLYHFAKALENLFHGQSSGVDIAGVLADEAIVFHQQVTPEKMQMRWQPKWYLSYSNQIGITSHCVKKVKELFDKNIKLAERIDEDMKNSVLEAKEALQLPQDLGLGKLISAINKAKVCFSQWGLAGGKVEQHINHLLEAGALAAKPTGSGDGGYVISLWSETPPEILLKDMIKI